MDEQTFLDFVSALGEEFCGVLAPVVGGGIVESHEGYEVVLRAFGQEPDPQLLASLSASQYERLRATCVEYFECQDITVDHLRTAVSRTLFRWPADDT